MVQIQVIFTDSSRYFEYASPDTAEGILRGLLASRSDIASARLVDTWTGSAVLVLV